jgi:hypothetical protein
MMGLEQHSINLTLERMPADGRRHVLEALQDPSVRDIAFNILRSPNPNEALAAQAEADIAEAMSPTGKPVVFKTIAKTIAPRIQRGMAAMADALPFMDTPDGQYSMDLVLKLENPQAYLSDHLMAVALDAAFPEGDLQAEAELTMAGLGGFGKSLKKIFKKVVPIAKIAIPIVAGGVATVFGGPMAGAAVMSIAGSAMNGFKTGATGAIGGMFGAVAGSAGGGIASGGGGGITSMISSILPAAGGGGATSGSTASGIASAINAITSAFAKKQAAPVAAVAQTYAQPAIQQAIQQPVAPQIIYVPQAAPAAAPVAAATTASTPTWIWVAGGGVAAVGVLLALSGGGSGRSPRRRR